eukprot:CAMPEP_0170492172 /NCGR_PEP_ID=MMETSP0208-20121228/11805_1 /TAXON_ID=197538 /ORGANISM="Strombidium inclinatum, Strain S3" /LENGTH=74 /DNA_ID=CAMNT_0010767873 /DNA_START=47 /DNA_END=271 /DNA_ORIENTATION=+
MTCDGCKNSILRILGKDAVFGGEGCSLDANVPEKKLRVILPTEDKEVGSKVVELLSKWSSANDKKVEFVGVKEA